MKGYAMLRIGEAGWIEKEDPKCGPMDAICRPVALAPCSSDIHTVYEGGVGERHNMMLGHEAVGEVVEVRCYPTWSPPDFTGLSSPTSNPVMS